MNLSQAQNSELIAEMNRRPDFPVVRRQDVAEIASRIANFASLQIDGSPTQLAYQKAHAEVSKLI